MNSHLRSLKQRIDDGMYLVDELTVADAIMARASARATVAHAAVHTALRPPLIRSFCRDDHARSFRLQRRSRLAPTC